jgi:DNA helicase-2/ATP-dependent DNA helicase PcrA
LEFPVVFIVGLEENILPHSRSMEVPDEMEEERRLMYVGVTRAKDQLYLVRAFRRMLYGRAQLNEPSRFLRDAMAARGVAADQGLSNGSSSWSRPSRAGTSPSAHRAAADSTNERGWGIKRRSPIPGRDDRGQSDRRSPGGGEPVSSGVKGWAPGVYSRQPVRSSPDPDLVPQFKPGDRVEHGLFGQGIVVKSELTADDEEVTVTFAGKGTKTLMASLAKLHKVG